MKKNAILFLSILFAHFSFAQETVTLEVKSTEGQLSWSDKPAKVLDRIANFKPSKKVETAVNRYGSSLFLKFDSTGFFHTTKFSGRWMLVDPDGYGSLNLAVTSLYKGASGKLDESETQTAYDRLWQLGFNGIGNFTNEDQTITYNGKGQNGQKQFSYTRALNFFLSYKNQRRTYYPDSPTTAELGNSGLNHVVVLDPKFIEFCVGIAANMVKYKNERNLLGYFTDNEINFNQDQLYNFLNDLPDTNDPSYKAAMAFIAARGLVKSQITKGGNGINNVNIEFAAYLAERYYKITDSVMKIYDDKHLNLGSRLHGRPRALEGVVKAAAKYCSVVSANFYDNYCPNDEITSSTKWETWIDKPVLVGEFYSKGNDAKTAGYVENNEPGAGWLVKTQADRGVWFQNTFLELAKSRNVVGWHYFKYRDGSDGSNKGLYAMVGEGNGSLTNAQQEYTALANAMEKINKQRYNVLKHYYPAMLDTLERKITAFSIICNMQSYTGNITGRNITVNLPDGIDPSTLVPTFTTSPADAKLYIGSEEQESGNNVVSFVNNVSYKFASRNAFDTAYKVNANTRPVFERFAISSNWRLYDGTITGNQISVVVPENANPMELLPSFNISAHARAYVGNEEQHSMTAPMIFTTPVTYRLQMPNMVENSYEVSVQFGEQPTGITKPTLNVSVSCRDKTLFFSDIEGDYEVNIFNVQGVCIKSQTLTSSASLPLSQVGVFFVQVRQGEKYAVQKIVVQ